LEVVDADSGTEGIQIGLGDFLSPDFIATNTANNTTGVIDFGIAQMAPHGAVSGSGTLATITFRGKAAGTANVVFTSVLLSDPGGSEIPSSAQNGTVTVAGSAATDTPTPTTTATPTATATGPTPTPTATSTGPTATATATTPAATKTTSPPPSSCTIQGYHTVRAGETLYSIGRAYATRPSAIASCNGIVNPSKLYVGTKLAIPVAPWSPIPPGPVAHRQFTPGGAPPPPPPAPGCRYYHTIRYGETLTLIAARYGVSIWTIARANNIYNLNLIYAGDVLCIP
jgi:lysozyme